MMRLTLRTDDDIVQIFEGNEYIGYVDSNNDLWLFDLQGFAEKICKVDHINKVGEIIRKTSSSQVTNPARPPADRTIS